MKPLDLPPDWRPDTTPLNPFACWQHVVIAWVIAGVRTKDDVAEAWKKPTVEVLTTFWEYLHNMSGAGGLWYCDELRTFRLRRNALRLLLNPDWLRLQARNDREGREEFARFQRKVGVFYRGKPMYDLTTKFIGTERFDALRGGTLTWEELELPAAVRSILQDTFLLETTGVIPYDGAVIVGYEARDTILVGLTDDPFIIALLKQSAETDVRGAKREGALAFSPAERARWLRGDRDLSFLETIATRLDPSFKPEPEPDQLTSNAERNKVLSDVRNVAEQIHWNGRMARKRQREDDRFQETLDDAI